MNLFVNGEPHAHSGDGTIATLLKECDASGGRIALMVNGAVVARVNWADTVLKENDRIELLVFAAGG